MKEKVVVVEEKELVVVEVVEVVCGETGRGS